MTSRPPTVWDIVSNSNIHVKKSFYEQVSKHRDNQIIKGIYLLISKHYLNNMFFFHEGVITKICERYVLTKRRIKRVNL